MSEEMKLIEALCKALGFIVMKTVDREERKESPKEANKYIPLNGSLYTHLDRELRTDIFGAYTTDKEGFYTSILKTPIVTYTVKPKPHFK